MTSDATEFAKVDKNLPGILLFGALVCSNESHWSFSNELQRYSCLLT